MDALLLTAAIVAFVAACCILAAFVVGFTQWLSEILDDILG